jgi:hypothetical protein
MALTKKAQADLIKLTKQSFGLHKPKSIRVDPDTGVIDVEAKYVNLKVRGHIPVKLGVVRGDFDCSGCYLTDLTNAPHTVTGSFRCNNNLLTTLQHGPQNVGITMGNLNSETYYCGDNPLADLTDLPAQFNGRLQLFYLDASKLQQLKSLAGLPASCWVADVSYKPDLGLLRLIELPVAYVRDQWGNIHPITEIIRKYKGQGKPGALKAAAELIKAGYKGNARW